MRHDIAHHADDVGDQHDGQNHRDAFGIAAEQRRDEDADGKIDHADEEHAEINSEELDRDAGDVHFPIEDPDDNAGQSVDEDAEEDIADDGADGLLPQDAAAGDGQGIEKFDGASAFFPGERFRAEDAGVDPGEKQRKLIDISRILEIMAEIGNGGKTEDPPDQGGQRVDAGGEGFGRKGAREKRMQENQQAGQDGDHDRPADNTGDMLSESDAENGHHSSPPLKKG